MNFKDTNTYPETIDLSVDIDKYNDVAKYERTEIDISGRSDYHRLKKGMYARITCRYRDGKDRKQHPSIFRRIVWVKDGRVFLDK